MNENLTYGLDYRGGKYLQASTDNSLGRPRIESLQCFRETPHFPESSERQIVFAIPDSEAIVKYLRIPQGIPVDLESAIRFELSQAMLDDEATLAYDYLASHAEDNYLGFIFRRKRLEETADQYGLKAVYTADASCSFKTRAAALAGGYLAFCHRAEADLLCLAGITECEISIAFLLQKAVVDLASLKFPRSDSGALEKTAIDFKTLVNFKLAALAGRGISQPMAAIIVINDNSDNSLSTALTKYFPMRIARPSFIEEYLPDEYREPDFPLEKYVVALGLTVN